MNAQHEQTIAKWLRQAEKAFALLADILEGVPSGTPPAAELPRYVAVTREMQSQARQLRSMMTTPSPDLRLPHTFDKYASRRRTRQTFRLRAREHRGGREGNERLVCYLEGEPGLLAIWGTRGQDMQHIEAVERAGFPLTVECDWIEPDAHEATNFGHKYWVREGDHLRIVR